MISEQLQFRSYAPYSGHPEFVVVQSRSGALFPGVRIENISFPLTIPAVQCGLVTCLSEGEEPEILYLPETGISESKLTYWMNELNLTCKNLTGMSGEITPVFQEVTNISTKLKSLLKQAVIPHSDFPVSTLLDTNYGFIGGVNIEFSAWNTGLCAERTAIAKALAYGVDTTDINAIHLHTEHGEYSSPCGACRQVIVEHLPRMPVFIHHADGSTSRHFSSDLLPYSFKSDFLSKKSTKA